MNSEMRDGVFPSQEIQKNIENKKTASNEVDAEFEALESGFSLEERMWLTRELFDEVFDPPISRGNFYEHVLRLRAKDDGELKHFLLPNIPGGEGSLKDIREGYDQRAEYLKTDNRTFVKVGQGEMWVLPKSANPYFQVSMSECSAIVGSDSENFIVAHVSYSEMNEVEAAIDFIKDNGIDTKDIHVFASVGEFQEKSSAEEYTKRDFDSSSYTKAGIPESNIRQFEFSPGEIEEDGSWLSKNVTQVIGCNDALFKYSFDLKNTPRPGMIFPREEIQGDYRDEKIIEISNSK